VSFYLKGDQGVVSIKGDQGKILLSGREMDGSSWRAVSRCGSRSIW